MKKLLFAISLIVITCSISFAKSTPEVIFKVDTETNFLGSNHRIEVMKVEDLDFPGIFLYVSYAVRGGIKGDLGFADEESRFDLDYIKEGVVKSNPKIKSGKTVEFLSKSAGPFFRSMLINRYYDGESNSLVYLVIARGAIKGSPYNQICAVKLD